MKKQREARERMRILAAAKAPTSDMAPRRKPFTVEDGALVCVSDSDERAGVLVEHLRIQPDEYAPYGYRMAAERIVGLDNILKQIDAVDRRIDLWLEDSTGKVIAKLVAVQNTGVRTIVRSCDMAVYRDVDMLVRDIVPIEKEGE